MTGLNSLNSIALRPWTYFDVELLETEEEKFAADLLRCLSRGLKCGRLDMCHGMNHRVVTVTYLL